MLVKALMDSSKNINFYSYNKSKDHANLLGLTGKNPDQALFRVGGYLKKGGAPKDVTAQVLSILAEYCQPPIPVDLLRAKVERAYQGIEDREKSLADRIRAWIEALSVTPGATWSATDCDRDLCLVTARDKANRRKIISRLVASGVIEPASRKAGVFRKVDRTEQLIDWQHAENGHGLQLRWPLGLEERFEVMPGSLVVVAGETNAGKTAFLLNVARDNLSNFPTFYFSSSSETNAVTLRRRIEAFGDPHESWAAMTAISRASDFHDVIRPNGLNLVDYLEVHDDFYLIGRQLAAIAAKLRNGVAVIAIQKSPGADFGRGGPMTLEKAAVYLTLHRGDLAAGEPHTLRLPKIKYPLVEYASKPIKFKLAGGARFIRV
ncbi:MAG: hypothetical protein LDL11_06600 [Desulfarculus sp.]|nr:hypothetical protein [Desulfarculus sp.]